MALDAHDDSLMSVDGFPVNLKEERKKTKTFFHFRFSSHISLLVNGHFTWLYFTAVHVKLSNETAVCGKQLEN